MYREKSEDFNDKGVTDPSVTECIRKCVLHFLRDDDRIWNDFLETAGVDKIIEQAMMIIHDWLASWGPHPFGLLHSEPVSAVAVGL
jgi:hypothetical protein